MNSEQEKKAEGCMSCRRSEGFTLIEVVVSLCILILLLFSFGYLIFLSSVNIRSSAHHSTAVNLAENMMERIRALKWADVEKGVTYDGLKEPPASSANTGASNQFPPTPYPRASYVNYYTSSTSRAQVSHETNYSFIVRTYYDPDYPATQDLLFVIIDVYWRESSSAGGSFMRKVSLSSELINSE
jgi:Tfp pilus assembly protein PilV